MDSVIKPGEYLECLVCLQLCSQAVECQECGQLMCQACADHLRPQQCPLCRKNLNVKPNLLARRMIGNLPVKCSQCGTDSTIGNLNDHNEKCPKRLFKCQITGCSESFEKSQVQDHAIDKHQKDIFNMIVTPVSEIIQNDFDRIAKVLNDKNYFARLGSNGKYYCGQRLDINCQCCNGYCGPTSGCNCKSCMRLDLKSKCLPKCYLVNDQGAPVRKGTTQHFYCGRKVMQNVYGCDGWCGPNNGPACNSCIKITQQANIYLS